MIIWYRVVALQKSDFFKTADFSVIVNISVKTKFDAMLMLLWTIKPDKNKVLNKIFTQRYTKRLTRNDQFYEIYRICGKRKTFSCPFHKPKFVLMAFMTWFNLTCIFISLQISNLFLVMWSHCFQNVSAVQEKKVKKKLTWKATYLEPKAPFYIFSECCKVLL